MSFIGDLHISKKFTAKKILTSTILFLLPISAFSLKSWKSHREKLSFPVTTEERIWLREFFRDFLFDRSLGAYTLFGSKPVTLSDIYTPSEEEIEKTEEFLKTVPKDRIKTFPYDYAKNYEKWKSIKYRFKIRNYLFGEFPAPFNKKDLCVLFVNIENTVRTLVDHYAHFRRVLGYDFDPLDVVFDVENKDSKFWNDVISNQFLLGVVLGYDKSDCFFFESIAKSWDENFRGKRGVQEFLESLPTAFSDEELIPHQKPSDFNLPIFRRYGASIHDKKITALYEEERKKIKSLYKGQDEVDVALSWLCR